MKTSEIEFIQTSVRIEKGVLKDLKRAALDREIKLQPAINQALSAWIAGSAVLRVEATRATAAPVSRWSAETATFHEFLENGDPVAVKMITDMMATHLKAKRASRPAETKPAAIGRQKVG
jgi:hypothetical protein